MTDFKQDHPDGIIAALDEMSLYLQATPQQVWYPVGQRPVLRVHPQRTCQHWYGALCLQTGQQVALSVPALNAATTLHFLAHLLTVFPTQPILLFLEAFGDVPFAPPGTAASCSVPFLPTIPVYTCSTFRLPVPISIPRNTSGKLPVTQSATTTPFPISLPFAMPSLLFLTPPCSIFAGLSAFFPLRYAFFNCAHP
jgi:hypothetical protein